MFPAFNVSGHVPGHGPAREKLGPSPVSNAGAPYQAVDRQLLPAEAAPYLQQSLGPGMNMNRGGNDFIIPSSMVLCTRLVYTTLHCPAGE